MMTASIRHSFGGSECVSILTPEGRWQCEGLTPQVKTQLEALLNEDYGPDQYPSGPVAGPSWAQAVRAAAEFLQGRVEWPASPDGDPNTVY